MFKWLLHQTHWLLGITIGLVLPVVGVTGAIMAFEDPIMEALSPGIVQLAPRAEPVLTPDGLLSRFALQKPGAVPTLLIMHTGPQATRRTWTHTPAASWARRTARPSSPACACCTAFCC